MKQFLTLCVLLLALVSVAVGQQQAGVGVRGTNSIDFAPNDTSTGTLQYHLAKIVLGKVIKATTTDTNVPLFVVSNGGPFGGPPTPSITGDAIYVINGPIACYMDATNPSGVSGRPITPSALVDGRCHVMVTNAPSYTPACGWVAGTMADDATTIGTLAKINAHPFYTCPASGAGSGTVTSAGLSMPTEFAVANTPITTSNVFTVTKTTQTANTVYAGPVSGGAAQPTFRLPVSADITAALAATAAAGDLSGTYPGPTVSKASATFALAGDIRPTALSGNVNDYTPTGAATNAVWYIDGGAVDRTISGMLAGSDGEIKLLVNKGTTNALLLPNQSASSSAINRFLFGGDTRLFPGESQALIYDADAAVLRWKPFGAVMLDAHRIRSFSFAVGSVSASSAPIAADDAILDGYTNRYGRDVEILSVACKANNTGLVITPILQGGSATSILTGALTCGNAVWAGGTVQATAPIIHSFTPGTTTCAVAPCAVDTSWTTTGLATSVTVDITGRLR